MKYEKLTGNARDRARDWVLTGQFDDASWAEFVIDDFIEVCKCIGFTVEDKNISWDCYPWHAAFTCSFAPKFDGPAKLREHAPQDTKLHEIADKYNGWQITMKLRFGAGVAGRIMQSGYGYLNMEMQHFTYTEDYPDGDDPETAEEALEAAKDLAHWLARQLEEEYDYQSSDEYVRELCDGNGWYFDREGELVPRERLRKSRKRARVRTS